ncbi:helix-turn-helix domain-containing protein [Spirillospora sp. CA-128828]|uniref:helix-turn-helix domain-containing protein n=1 Tax=Spirillospora sp. CA-128828 TaxID=3240033 RepID=UPI003D9412A6
MARRVPQTTGRRFHLRKHHSNRAEAARARGRRLGRPPALTPDRVRQARALLTRPDESVSSIARLLGVSRSTLYKYVPEAKGGALTIDAAQAQRVPARWRSAPSRSPATSRTTTSPFAQLKHLPVRCHQDHDQVQLDRQRPQGDVVGFRRRG